MSVRMCSDELSHLSVLFTQYEFVDNERYELSGGIYYDIPFRFCDGKLFNCDELSFPTKEVDRPTIFELSVIDVDTNRRSSISNHNMAPHICECFTKVDNLVITLKLEEEQCEK
ncbi:MAG: hypothetical protein NC548_61470 [Lachnospiraceae bacterium]|nr:hypothetical protein [Lachnospiraceae bacterium]